ncbi:hypothetical protein CC80DRAFT_269781 [Byssothecium circinans]|uniref:Zn(2)-C6 fungal-type domain-containing protein n=1 Tax=Byssothecium circinans TaxID=147558 RepID=A0A6A5U814_9PLEO|nr:hypothetical protein CC80DRAFT_269781 [Byssothecium circinans]
MLPPAQRVRVPSLRSSSRTGDTDIVEGVQGRDCADNGEADKTDDKDGDKKGNEQGDGEGENNSDKNGKKNGNEQEKRVGESQDVVFVLPIWRIADSQQRRCDYCWRIHELSYYRKCSGEKPCNNCRKDGKNCTYGPYRQEIWPNTTARLKKLTRLLKDVYPETSSVNKERIISALLEEHEAVHRLQSQDSISGADLWPERVQSWPHPRSPADAMAFPLAQSDPWAKPQGSINATASSLVQGYPSAPPQGYSNAVVRQSSSRPQDPVDTTSLPPMRRYPSSQTQGSMNPPAPPLVQDYPPSQPHSQFGTLNQMMTTFPPFPPREAEHHWPGAPIERPLLRFATHNSSLHSRQPQVTTEGPLIYQNIAITNSFGGRPSDGRQQGGVNDFSVPQSGRQQRPPPGAGQGPEAIWPYRDFVPDWGNRRNRGQDEGA